MQKNTTYLTLIFLLAALLPVWSAKARTADSPIGNTYVQSQKPRAILHYQLIDGDTVFVENLRPSYVWGWRRQTQEGKNWRKYYKMVHNFSRAYPYAILARKVVKKTDSIFIAENMSAQKRQKYVDKLQKDIIYNFEDVLRHMTVSQGKLLIKLIDREVGLSSFDIIKNYKNGIAAKFWQGIAKMFGSDLTKGYDPTGADKDLEELVQIWDRGDFPFLYYSIFGKYPKVPVIPSKFR